MKLDKKLLKTICEIQTVTFYQEKMQLFLLNYLTARDFEVDVDQEGNIYVNRSLSDVPCIVAHMDTVHDLTEDLSVFEHKDVWIGINRETMKQTGIGGDDKVGIYIALELLKAHSIKAAFFVDEEVGCQGSELADMKFFENCLYVLQCDRRGNNDFVTRISGTLSSKQFQMDVYPILKRYDYRFCEGMITDVGQLAENKIGISVANLSCGYYNPHCNDEYIVLSDVLHCMNLCDEIIRGLTKRYVHKYKAKYTYKLPKYTKYKNWEDWDDDDAPIDLSVKINK